MRHAIWVAALAGVVSSAVPRTATACGGTFCDGAANAMPVDQTGENILFVRESDHVEAHIQIQYQGDPERFAWVIPIETVPDTVAVGSQILFANLLGATVPRYALRGCPALLNGGGGGVRSSPGAAPPVQVLLSRTVGAFDVTVLRGRSGKEVGDWLVANQYRTLPAAPALLDDYAKKNFVFVALKLTAGAGIDEIHPLVVRYPGTHPCIPLKLTSVAAVNDMSVRAFFLGAGRVAPTAGYRHVTLDLLKLDWINAASNYKEVVSHAIDEAGGRAFVTEFAGPSSTVSTAGIFDPRWDANAFLGLARTSLIDTLTAQGLATCSAGTCTFAHPLILPLLREHAPAPPGVDEMGYYSCLGCYPDAGAAAWDAAAFARGFQERVVVPGRHASELLAAHPYLTRLLSTLSPDEMTEDPLFAERADLPDVAALQIGSAACGGNGKMLLPDGSAVSPTGTGDWPSFPATLPWARLIEEYPDASRSGDAGTAAATVIASNADAINAALEEWNASRPPPPSLIQPSLGGFMNPPSAPPLYGDASAAPAGPAPRAVSPRGGCGCHAAGSATSRPGQIGLGALALALALRRRRTGS